MNKTDLIAKVAEKTKHQKKTTEETITAFLSVIQETLVTGEEIRFIGFGNFVVVERKATTGHNPRTGEEIKIPASRQAKFRPGKQLKEALNPRPPSGAKVLPLKKKKK